MARVHRPIPMLAAGSMCMLIGAVLFPGCGNEASNDPDRPAGGGGEAQGGRTGMADSPTRRCVLAGTCGTCFNEEECWEGFPEGDCPSFVEGAVFSEEICPELGFPVNCSGQNKFEPPGTECEPRGTGGSGATGSRSEGDRCSSSTQCPAGTECEPYYGNPSNENRCMRKCTGHGDCLRTAHPDFILPFQSCDFCDNGSRQCLPLSVCGYSGGSSNACNDCLASCRGLSSCCTGCGCICESDCGQC